MGSQVRVGQQASGVGGVKEVSRWPGGQAVGHCVICSEETLKSATLFSECGENEAFHSHCSFCSHQIHKSWKQAIEIRIVKNNMDTDNCMRREYHLDSFKPHQLYSQGLLAFLGIVSPAT